jgi:hypothetical protein
LGCDPSGNGDVAVQLDEIIAREIDQIVVRARDRLNELEQSGAPQTELKQVRRVVSKLSKWRDIVMSDRSYRKGELGGLFQRGGEHENPP